MFKLVAGLPLILLAACTVQAASGRVALSGDRVSRPFAAAGFDKVSLRGPFDVIVRVGPAAGVRATGDSALLDRLDIRVEDGELVMGYADNTWILDKSDVDIAVTLPAIAAASVRGSGTMRVDRVEAPRFAAAVGGSGMLRIAGIDARDLAASVGGSGEMILDRITAGPAKFAVAGSGDLRAKGVATRSTVSVTGSGSLDAIDLMSDTASIAVSGSGDAAIGARRSAAIAVKGSGNARVRGTTNCQIATTGSGKARCSPS